MKSIIAGLAVVLTAGLLAALGGCTEKSSDAVVENPVLAAPVPAGMTRGSVLETMNTGGYTYALLETSRDQRWVAGPETSIAVGDIVQVSQGMPMTDFTSKTLNRTFDVVFFVDAIDNLTSPQAGATPPHPTMPPAAETVDTNVPELEPGQNIAWVYANKDSLADQSISLRGKVVKYNSNILDWNYFHIQDGSGDAAHGNHDLTVTSKATTAVGDTVVVTGTIVLDKDLGAGYVFPVLLEDAAVSTE
ncbi:MAG: hypothetical protein OEZ11_01655 [Gammaproteobacteria bacterium]|nr:hypothetical protein [Gammaproteobacteria bacterium]